MSWIVGLAILAMLILVENRVNKKISEAKEKIKVIPYKKNMLFWPVTSLIIAIIISLLYYRGINVGHIIFYGAVAVYLWRIYKEYKGGMVIYDTGIRYNFRFIEYASLKGASVRNRCIVLDKLNGKYDILNYVIDMEEMVAYINQQVKDEE